MLRRLLLPRTHREIFLSYLAAGVVAALIGLLWNLVAHAQTSPSFCGKASVATPRSSLITSGTAHATASVTNAAVLNLTTSSTPQIPVLSQGSIVGVLVSVRTSTIVERHDGTNPTNDTGNEYGSGGANGSTFVVCGSDLVNGNLKLVGNTGTAALVIFDFYTDGK